MADALGTQTIIKTRVTLVFAGYGDLTLTDVALIWNKSATSFLTFGVFNLATSNHWMLPLADIAKVETYTYLPGGGLVVTDKNGKVQKIAFKKAKDFKVVHHYLTEYMASKA